MHAGNSVPAEEVNKFLLAHRLHLAGFDRLCRHFVRNVGQHRAETHHVAGARDFQNHGLAVTRRRGDLHLAVTEDKNRCARYRLR